jgi:hypothetical protein
MLLPHLHDAGKNSYLKRANRSFGNVSQLKYLGTTAKNKKMIQEEIKR